MDKLILAAAAATLNVNVDIQNVERDGDIISAVFKVESTQSYSTVMVECAFLGKDKRALDIGVKPLLNLSPGSERYGKISIVRKSDDVTSAKCYIDTAQ